MDKSKNLNSIKDFSLLWCVDSNGNSLKPLVNWVNEFTFGSPYSSSPTPLIPGSLIMIALPSTRGFVWMAPKWKRTFGVVPGCQLLAWFAVWRTVARRRERPITQYRAVRILQLSEKKPESWIHSGRVSHYPSDEFAEEFLTLRQKRNFRAPCF